jgi:hypothetical protein
MEREIDVIGPEVTKLVLLALVIGFFAIRAYRGKPVLALGHAAVWVALFAGVFLAVSLLADLGVIRP